MHGRGCYGQPAMMPYYGQPRMAYGQPPLAFHHPTFAGAEAPGPERSSLFDTRGHTWGKALVVTLLASAVVGVGFGAGQGLVQKIFGLNR
ncbi:MAG TPA: hypothetical protein VLE97_10825 [Gaiellaceae bacterium]|nr:hypothetical protein [Gaiellaceae bacterium]